MSRPFVLSSAQGASLVAALLAFAPTFQTFVSSSLAADDAPGTLRLLVRDAANGDSTPCRVHLRDPLGKPVKPTNLPFWHDHFVTDGRVELALPPGEYTYTIERGPEFHAVQGRLRVMQGAVVSVTNELRRLANLTTEGWWSGDLHVHRPLSDIELLMRAEDLHIAPVITWWNSRGPWVSAPRPVQPVVRFDGARFYAPLGGEDERGGGALLYFGLPEPLGLGGLAREFPPSMKFLREAKEQRGTWVDIEKPFWWDTPAWLASDRVDSVGIAHNHLHRDGVLDNEAWGRPRDRLLFPGPQGNGRYTQELFYHLLNCGLRLPPSAGSASGVLPNPVGYNRVYVHVEGELTWEKWWDGLRAGRVFVGNGPLLRARAEGQFPGHVFRSDGPISVLVESRIDSREPVLDLELVRNGYVERLASPQRITLRESGWFLVRAVADVTNTFRFASTGPWYVEIGDRPRPVRRQAAQFFLDWTHERQAAVAAALSDANQRAEAIAPWKDADDFWRGKLAESVP